MIYLALVHRATTTPPKGKSVAFIPFYRQFFSPFGLIGAMLIALSTTCAHAAELVMFEQAGCVWCESFNREIAPVYDKTDEGRRAPLRRVDIASPPPQEPTFIEAERLTPLFVLVDKGREVGRIRGYPGEDNFWGLLGALIKKLDAPTADHSSTSTIKKHYTRPTDLLYSVARHPRLLVYKWNCSHSTATRTRQSWTAWSATLGGPPTFSKRSRMKAD
jgi:hypothetical protein